MLKIVIIEDEAPARKKLKNYIEKTREPFEIIKEIETVDETQSFFQTHPDVDLVFSDIELRDGNVFDVYNEIEITAPIIFITAYDSFWMNAFESSGIEYLLKPYSYPRFEKAWLKYTFLKNKMKVKDVLKESKVH